MTENLFQVWSGKEQDRGMMAQLMVFAVPSPINNLTSEMFFSKAAKESVTGMQMIQPSRKHEAAPGKIDDYGMWWVCTVAVPDTEIIKIVGTRKTGDHGTRQDRASMYIQARAKAARQKVIFELTGSPIMARSEVSLEGRFDVLTEEEVDAIDAKLINPYQRAELGASRVRRTFRLETIQPEIERRPEFNTRVVVNNQGRAVSVAVPKRRRRLKI